MILLTGASGYIGSHTAVELLNAGKEIIIVDDLSNSDAGVIDRIAKIAGKRPVFYQADVANREAVEQIFRDHKIDAVIHFAGFKAVGESMRMPLAYYRNNLDSTLTLLEIMREHGCNRLVFSSSATVYGTENAVPYVETMPIGGCSSPYGWTKFMIEQIIRDTASAYADFSAVMLRYFNPTGAHESGLLGEDPNGTPNNLMPYILQVADGSREYLQIFGNDYPTNDGTGVRDYIHVADLALGHLAALDYTQTHTGVEAINLGTGNGYSVLDVVQTFEKVNHVKVPYQFAARRAGDIAEFYSDPSKAERLLGWKASRSLDSMCLDSWRWQKHCKSL